MARQSLFSVALLYVLVVVGCSRAEPRLNTPAISDEAKTREVMGEGHITVYDVRKSPRTVVLSRAFSSQLTEVVPEDLIILTAASPETIYRVEFELKSITGVTLNPLKSWQPKSQNEVSVKTTTIWPYQIAVDGPTRYFVLKGGVPVYSFTATEEASAINLAMAWLDVEITGRLARYRKGYLALQGEEL